MKEFIRSTTPNTKNTKYSPLARTQCKDDDKTTVSVFSKSKDTKQSESIL